LGDEVSRTTFQLVQTLAGKNVKKVFAGGSHTWVLIDYDMPNIESYDPPSPIHEEPVLNKEISVQDSSIDRCTINDNIIQT